MDTSVELTDPPKKTDKPQKLKATGKTEKAYQFSISKNPNGYLSAPKL